MLTYIKKGEFAIEKKTGLFLQATETVTDIDRHEFKCADQGNIRHKYLYCDEYTKVVPEESLDFIFAEPKYRCGDTVKIGEKGNNYRVVNVQKRNLNKFVYEIRRFSKTNHVETISNVKEEELVEVKGAIA